MDFITESKDLLKKFDTPDLESKIEEKLKQTQEFGSLFGYQDEKYITTLREYNTLLHLTEVINNLKSKLNSLESSFEAKNDPELVELAEAEINELQPEINALLSELKLIVKKPLKDDEKKAIFEIRPGVGGVEASLFAQDLFNMYTKYCSMKGFPIEVFNIDYNTEGGINEAVFIVNEPGSFGHFRFEAGVHRVQRVPTTEASGRIHTSTASVAILPNIEKTDINIKPEELRIDVYRSSGPGGQSVNTTDSAVRVTHIPTGITVSCQNSKSQHKNKEVALSVLMSKLQEIEDAKVNKSEMNLREEAIRGGDRSAKIRTYNFPQGRITDHRINQSWFNINEVMNGYVDNIINEESLILREE